MNQKAHVRSNLPTHKNRRDAEPDVQQAQRLPPESVQDTHYYLNREDNFLEKNVYSHENRKNVKRKLQVKRPTNYQ